jgi:plastocyanin
MAVPLIATSYCFHPPPYSQEGEMITFDSIRLSVIVRWMLVLAVLIAPRLVLAQWQATVGAQSDDLGRQAMAFLPNEMWIHAGDSITWTFATDEIHTVSFLISGQIRPPYQVGCPGFSSGTTAFDGSTCVTTAPAIKGETFTVDFPVAGNFKLVCLVHRDMTAVVHVLELSEPLPHTQSFYDEQAQVERGKLLSEGHLHSEHPAENKVIAGMGTISGTPGGLENLVVMRFMNRKTVIHAGETVEWSNSDPTASHTITFGTEPANPMPPSTNVTVDPDGARHAVINSTEDSVHSGFIVAASQERVGLPQSPVGVTRFRVTFSHAGIYPYICALHDNLGMKGTVVVLP